ncbi:MAG: hypothetical protein ACI9HK_000915 [Pirellulaceae bacterium]
MPCTLNYELRHIGLKEFEDGSFKPEIKVVEAGIVLELYALAKSDTVQVDFAAKSEKLDSVDTKQVLGRNGKQMEFEIPHVTSQVIRSKVAIPRGKSIVMLGGVRVGGEAGRQFGIVFTPHVINSFEEEPVIRRDVISEVIRAKRNEGGQANQYQAIDKTTKSSLLRAIENAARALDRWTNSDVGQRIVPAPRSQPWRAIPFHGLNTAASDEEVLRLFRESRQLDQKQFASLKNVRLVNEKIADYVDRPRQFPDGFGQVSHQQYKCHVMYEVEGVGKTDVFHFDFQTIRFLNDRGEVIRRQLLPTTAIAPLQDTPQRQVPQRQATQPSKSFLDDDVQYFAPGPEFKLNRELGPQTKDK